MDDRLRATAVEAAQQLLHRFKEEHPGWMDEKTPIDELATWAGLQVETFHPLDYPAGTYGFLEPGEDLVWLCRDLSSTLRRFTLAHELGHAVLHRDPAQQTSTLLRSVSSLATMTSLPAPYPAQQNLLQLSSDDPCQRPDVQEEVIGLVEQEQFEEVLGIGQSYDPRSQRELAANLFAAELLMPLERVRSLYLDQRLPAHQLPALFGVSSAALLNRLAGLLTEPMEPLAKETASTASRPVTVKKQYDEFQQAAIEAPTPALIVAGPGSGKTSTLIGRAVYLVHTLHVPAEQILALTFSRKAAQEMQERLQATLLSDHETSMGKRPVPTVSTFHAFCAETLRTYAEKVGLRLDFALVDEAEGYFILRQQAKHLRLEHYRNLHTPTLYFSEMLHAISRAKDELVSPADYQRLAECMLTSAGDEETRLAAQKALEVAHVYQLYQEGLEQRGDSDFGGLVMLTVQLLRQQPDVLYAIQQRYQHILVDEFQDMNRASGVLLRLLAGREQRVWVVGDANQAIYGFRGASPANIARFQEDYSGAVVLPLSRNYRSRPDIVALSERFRYRQLELGEEVEPAKNAPVRLTQPETCVTLAVAADNASELSGLVGDMRDKLAQGYRYQDLVVLCRTRSLARKVTRTLAAAGLPILEQQGMLEQEYIKDLLSIVLLVADPGGMGLLRAARQPAHSLSQPDIETLQLAARAQEGSLGSLISSGEVPPNMSVEGQRSLQRLSAILQALLRQTSNIWSLLAHYLFLETSIIRTLLREDSASNRSVLAHYTALLALARRYDQQQQALRLRQMQERAGLQDQEEQPAQSNQSDQPPPIQEQAKGFLDYLRVLLSLGQDGGNRQPSGEDGAESRDVIRVMTVHASKGLEFPVVYLPHLRQQNFPMRRHASAISPPAGMVPPEGEGNAAQEESAEACLFYVAVTRARDQLVLSYSERNGKQKAKPSQYLEALLAGLAEERITRLRWQMEGAGEGKENEEHVPGEDDVPAFSQPSASFLAAMKPETLHASAIEAYQRCPRQYLYSTIYGFHSSEEDGYLLLWQATRKTLEALQTPLSGEQATGSAGEVPSGERAKELYTHYWHELGGTTFPFAPLYEQHGHEVVELLQAKLRARGDTAWELRRSFTVELAGKPVQVTVDRVESSQQIGATPKYVRTRFGKSKEKPDVGPRELLYAKAYRQEHGGQKLELHSHNLSTGETFPITLSPKKEQSLVSELEESIQGMERDEYPARPDARICPSCPFFFICPA